MPTGHVIGNGLLIILCGIVGVLLARRRNTALLGICLSGFLAFLSIVMAVRPDLIVAVVPYRDLTFYDNLYPPAIVLVGLPSGGRAASAASYGRQNNWMAGFYHDVVYLGPDPADDRHVLIADPDMGIESWRIADLRFLFRGQAVMYEKK